MCVYRETEEGQNRERVKERRVMNVAEIITHFSLVGRGVCQGVRAPRNRQGERRGEVNGGGVRWGES